MRTIKFRARRADGLKGLDFIAQKETDFVYGSLFNTILSKMSIAAYTR